LPENYVGGRSKMNAKNENTLFGLPEEVKFCAKCVISNQRPNSSLEYKHSKDSKKKTIRFNSEGVCDACLVAEQKHEGIEWNDRELELKELCDRFRRNDGRYDCVVPGSGGKDSFYAAHTLKYKYGMNPLTVTWAPNIYTEWGMRNFSKWIHSGFDNELYTPSGITHRILTRVAVENLFHPFQAFMFGQKALAPRVALKYDIPLVFFGENEAEYGNPIEDSSSSQRDWSYFSESDPEKIFLGGASLQELYSNFGLTKGDLNPYFPSDPELIAKQGIQVHYLGYYLKWHPQSAYYYAVKNGGFEASPERTPGTYSKYNSIDDKIDDFHYYTTFIKFGIGRASYDAAQEIRSGDITREEGVALVHKFDGEYPKRFEREIFEYLSLNHNAMNISKTALPQLAMDKDYFVELADTFRSPHLWEKKDSEWSLRNRVTI
jgi:N-acetyl sugar amidotransferase